MIFMKNFVVCATLLNWIASALIFITKTPNLSNEQLAPRLNLFQKKLYEIKNRSWWESFKLRFGWDSENITETEEDVDSDGDSESDTNIELSI